MGYEKRQKCILTISRLHYRSLQYGDPLLIHLFLSKHSDVIILFAGKQFFKTLIDSGCSHIVTSSCIPTPTHTHTKTHTKEKKVEIT
jgi:hypothetical protein